MVMPLPPRCKGYTFAICFGISLFPFVAINLALYVAALNCCSGCAATEVGFPVQWYEVTWVREGVIWEAFVLDLMLALTASAISARILKPILQPNE
jgi:ABC-type spermidine/putrescine transport system permease subunit II